MKTRSQSSRETVFPSNETMMATYELDTEGTNTPVAHRTRSKLQPVTWGVSDKDVADLLMYLRNSNDPWEQSLIPGIEKAAK
jgi:hypothetical protein